MEQLRSAVRPLVTFAVAGALIGGFFLHLITADQFLPIALTVINFYFIDRTLNKKQGG
jgi:uncharacterized membrane protein YfcA